MKADSQVQHNGNRFQRWIFSKFDLSRVKISSRWLLSSIVLSSLSISTAVRAQVTPDGSTSTTVEVDGDNFTIEQGDRAGDNLFHSFDDFSVPTGGSAVFDNANDIVNIFSRVTGGNISDIDGVLGASGTANLFLINPAGIVFGSNASLELGGSFFGSTADSIVFEDGEFSASDTNAPVLTINAPIGLNFREEPGTITNSALDLEAFTGLGVASDQTIGLIGGDMAIADGLITTPGGRIELGSVGANSSVSLTEVDKGWDVGYEGVEDFGSINLTGGAFVSTDTFGTENSNTGDVEVQGGTISLTQGSQIAISTTAGQAGNLTVIASESLSIDGNGIEIGIGNFASSIVNNISVDGTGEGSQIGIDTPQLTLSNGSLISASVFGQDATAQGQGVDIAINASEIIVDSPFLVDPEADAFQFPGISSQVFADGFADGGDITIETDTLTINEGGQILADTSSAGNAGDLSISATELIELSGTLPNGGNPSILSTSVGETLTATGDAGNLNIDTARLVVRDGAQIVTLASNTGEGGTVTVNASDSILFSGTSTTASPRGGGRSGISVSAQSAFTDPESGEIIPTVGNGGTVNLTTGELTIEQGAFISVNTFSQGDGGNGNIDVDRLILREGGEISAGSFIGEDSPDPEADRGNGGTLNINASESVEIIGTGSINGELVNSGLLTLAESTGDAGNLNLTTDSLSISDGGTIDTSASATGAAGNLDINADTLDLDRGTINADTAAGTGGNIRLEIDENINLDNNSLISAAATGFANGGNIDIDTDLIIASPDSNSDIIASAEQTGTGGRITIDAESIFGLQVRPQSDRTNDLDASGGVDGEVIINTPDTDITGSLIEVPANVIESERIAAQACVNDDQAIADNALIINGKGGITPTPDSPLNSQNIITDGELTASQPESPTAIPISTSYGNLIPARGAIKTADGQIILTAYRPNSARENNPQISINCEKY